MPRNTSNKSNNKRYFGAGKEIPAASDEWFDAFTSDQNQKPSGSRPSNYRPSKFNTADLIRNIKEVNDGNPISREQEKGHGHDFPSLGETLRDLPEIIQRLPARLRMQLLILLIATVVLVAGVTSTLTYQSNPKPPTHTYANNVARIDYGDPSRFDREMQRYEPGKFPLEQKLVDDDTIKSNFGLGQNQNKNTNGLRQNQNETPTQTQAKEPQRDTNKLKELERAAATQNAEKHKIPAAGNKKGPVPGNIYYNLGSASPIPLSYEDYPEGGPVISILVTNRQKDVDELTTALKSLAFLKGDLDPDHKAPVLCFNEGDLSEEQINQIVSSCRDRPIAFPLVDFTEFPPGFNPEVEETKFKVKGRKEWGYYHMIRFWVTGIWKHPAIDHFDTVMRIDSDSCFKEENAYLPNLMNKDLYYHSQYVGFESGAEYVNGLYDFAVNYMKEVRIPSEPRNFLLWHFTTTVWTTMDTLPLFRTNFEVSKVSFMQRNDVSLWHDALTEQAPYGVYRHRWGDAVTRFLTASMFENQDRIMTIRPTGYFHKIGCSAEEVDEALAKYLSAQ